LTLGSRFAWNHRNPSNPETLTIIVCVGVENANRAFTSPPTEWSGAMFKQRRLWQMAALRDRLLSFANEVREKASRLGPGPERDELLKEARRADTAAHIEDWANSSGLRPPE
jgi:hypothetical protein